MATIWKWQMHAHCDFTWFVHSPTERKQPKQQQPKQQQQQQTKKDARKKSEWFTRWCENVYISITALDIFLPMHKTNLNL